MARCCVYEIPKQLGTAGLTCLHNLFTSHSYHHLEGPFLAEMAGQQTGLNSRETKLA